MTWVSQMVLEVKNLPASAGDMGDAGSVPGLGRSLEEGVATHSSLLPWKIPWTEKPGVLQSIGLQRDMPKQLSTHTWNDLAVLVVNKQHSGEYLAPEIALLSCL